MKGPPKQSFPPPPPMAPIRRASDDKSKRQGSGGVTHHHSAEQIMRRSSAAPPRHPPPPLVPESSVDITKQVPLVTSAANFHPAAIPTYSSTATKQLSSLPPSQVIRPPGSGSGITAPRRMSASSSSTGNISTLKESAEKRVVSDNIARNLSSATATAAPITSTTTINLYQQYNQTTAPSYSSQYPSPYLSNPSADTLKARNVGTATTNPGNFNLQQSSNNYVLNVNAPPTAATTTKPPQKQLNNNNIPIAILLLPPLLILLIYEMSSPLPLLLLCSIGLIVYALDLANVGGGIGSNSSSNTTHRGFYTLCAIWIGWIVLSIVVGYVTIFLGEMTLAPPPPAAIDDSSNSNISSSYRSTNFISLGILLAKLGTSIMLLFNLAAWTTLQFQWLPSQIPTLARFFERFIHFTLPPISAAMIAYELTVSSLSSSYVTSLSWGVDTASMVFPLLFACHLSLGILLVGAAPSMLGDTVMGKKHDDKDRHSKTNKAAAASVAFHCAISPREGRALSYLLVFAPGAIHLIMFRQRIINSYASWDDLFDFIFTATLPYVLHYLLASNGVLDERWRSSLNWLLRSGTSPVECGRTLRGASVPMAISFLSCVAVQQRYLVPVCARISYILNGHDGIQSASLATFFLSLGTLFGYATIWFFGRQNSNGEFLMGDLHEDVFQLLLGLSAVFFGLSCSPPWTALPIPMLLAESLALWVITKQLRYAFLTVFVFFTCCSILIAYRLTFLTERVEIVPGKQILLKKFATVSMFAAIWLIIIVGLVHRAPGGVGKDFMKKWDVTGVCFAVYGFVLIAMEFSLLTKPMPVYSRDNFEFGKVAVYSASAVHCTGLLTLIITWHLKAQKLVKGESAVVASSIALGKMIAVIIEPNLVDVGNSLSVLYLRWTVASLLLMTICCPYALRPVYVKSPNQLPRNASIIVVAYCAVILPSVILASVRLVLEPLVSLLTGHNSTAFYATSPKFSETFGYASALWGVCVLSMINHYLPSGGGDLWKRVSALALIMGLFVSFSAPAFPGYTPLNEPSNLFISVSSSVAEESDVATGGWGLVSAFLAALLALTGPLELREVKDSAGRKDSRHFLRLMIFGLMFGCGLAWFIVMQSMSKDVFIPIFVTGFSCMVMSTLGTVCSVMGYFLETQEFGEVEQIANVWTIVAFPVFFVISSVSLSAHAHPFGIGGWASTYLSVCGLFAGSFCILVRMRKEKNSTTRGYGNMGCIISWLCAIIVIYGRYGIAGVGVVGVTTVVGIPVSILATLCSSPILLLLEGEESRSSKHSYQRSSAKSKWHGLQLTKLTRRNWIAPLLIGTAGVFVIASLYAIFLRGCGLSKFSFLFGTTGDTISNQEDVFSHIFGSKRTTGIGALDDVATMAEKSVVHTKTMIAAARLSGSGIWTAKSLLGPLMHLIGLAATLPSLHYLVKHSWYGKPPLFGKVMLVLPLNILSIIVGRGIPSLVAAAVLGLIGGVLQLSTIKNG